MVNKGFLLGGLMVIGLGLAGCDGIGEDESTSLQHDKVDKARVKTINQIVLDKESREEYLKLRDKLSSSQREAISQEFITDKLAEPHVRNLGKTLGDGGYHYVFVVDITDKYTELYEDVIKRLSREEMGDKILVYFPNRKSSDVVSRFKGHDNIEVGAGDKPIGDVENLKLEYYPTFMHINDKNKIDLTLTGYYDYEVLKDKIEVFGGIK